MIFICLILLLRAYFITNYSLQIMQSFQAEQNFIQSTEQRWKVASYQHKAACLEYNAAKKIKQIILSDKHQISVQTASWVKLLKENMGKKVNAVNNIYLYFGQRLQKQRKARAWLPPQEALFSQQQLQRLSFVFEGPLKFDCLSHKLDNLVKEYELKCAALREDIKTTKLKLSLCEMEYKQFMASNTRRISDRLDNSK